jgi:hypothetical protein
MSKVLRQDRFSALRESLHRLNIYENRLYKFASDWTFESHDCARAQAAIAQT